MPSSPRMMAAARSILFGNAGGWGGWMGHPWGKNLSIGSWMPSSPALKLKATGLAKVFLAPNVVVEESNPSKYRNWLPAGVHVITRMPAAPAPPLGVAAETELQPPPPPPP